MAYTTVRRLKKETLGLPFKKKSLNCSAKLTATDALSSPVKRKPLVPAVQNPSKQEGTATAASSTGKAHICCVSPAKRMPYFLQLKKPGIPSLLLTS